MSVYLIADIRVTDDGWVPEYATNVHKLVEKHGGRYLSRSGNIQTLEGEEKDSTLIAILEFPSRAAFDGFASDPEYAPYGQARQSGRVSNFHLIDDTDIAGAIPYLKAGQTMHEQIRLTRSLIYKGIPIALASQTVKRTNELSFRAQSPGS